MRLGGLGFARGARTEGSSWAPHRGVRPRRRQGPGSRGARGRPSGPPRATGRGHRDSHRAGRGCGVRPRVRGSWFARAARTPWSVAALRRSRWKRGTGRRPERTPRRVARTSEGEESGLRHRTTFVIGGVGTVPGLGYGSGRGPEPPSRLHALTGAPGTGKSAILGWIAETGPSVVDESARRSSVSCGRLE